jgi:hypothetical protein
MAILTAMAIRLFYLLDCIPWLRRPRTSHRRLCTRDHIYFSGGKGGERYPCELFTGSLGDLRNPKAHHDPVVADPLVAVEEMMVASALLRILDGT